MTYSKHIIHSSTNAESLVQQVSQNKIFHIDSYFETPLDIIIKKRFPTCNPSMTRFPVYRLFVHRLHLMSVPK